MQQRHSKIKTSLHKLIRKSVTTLANASPVYRKKIDAGMAAEKGTQILLALKYKELLRAGGPFPTFDQVEFRAFSQNGEDGILLYIFSLIGASSKRAVEICAGDGIECNAANLIINHGWTALLFDGDAERVKRGKEFYATCQDTFIWPPKVVHAWVTRENINALIAENGFEGDVDLLSLDIDGMDYWIWESITCLKPRVVVAEYQDAWGPNKAVTVAYQANFKQENLGYGGASLAAFVRLARRKGYRLVGSQRYGFNAFFVRNGIGDDLLPEVLSSTCFAHPRHQRKIEMHLLNRYDWVEV